MSAAAGLQQASESDWPVTNCYIDAWIPILANWGLDPVAGLGVTVTLDYEADQFTFFKYLHEDLELLYGTVVGELAIYRSLEDQIVDQLRAGRLVLVEVDGFYLPDTRATSYRIQHVKTAIGIDSIDVENRHLGYFHNTGHFELSGADYDGAFQRLPEQRRDDALPPYVEFVKRRFPPLTGSELTKAAANLLRRHLARCPDANPLHRYRQDFPRHMQWLLGEPQRFHEYAFATFRQLGANFQLLATHLDWLWQRGVDGLQDARDAAVRISADAKTMQFKAARIAARGRFDPCDKLFDALESSYQTVIAVLERAVL
ncbi:MAG TPA: DUF1839 family protein [Acetobacteraceae bacterium]|nr:DUF1839 family protein [Acetobacteraceae bacterium]